MTDANSSAEELLSQARGNAVAFILTTIAYLEERGMAVEDFVDFFGRQFAPGWDELRARPMLEVARAVTRNAVSVGCTLGSLSGDEKRAEVLISGWPEAEQLSSVLGLDPNAGDAMWDSFFPLMEHLGIRYAWRREDGEVRLTYNARVHRRERFRTHQRWRMLRGTQYLELPIVSTYTLGQRLKGQGYRAPAPGFSLENR